MCSPASRRLWPCCRCWGPGWPIAAVLVAAGPRCAARPNSPRCRSPAAVSSGACRARSGQIELDVLIPRASRPIGSSGLHAGGGAPGRGVGLRGTPGGRACAPARRGHRRAHDPARGGLDRPSRRRAPGQGLLPRPGDRRPRAQPGKTASDAGLVAPRRLGGPARDRRCGAGRRPHRRPAGHRGRPRRPGSDRAGTGQARTTRRHRADHRQTSAGSPRQSTPIRCRPPTASARAG